MNFISFSQNVGATTFLQVSASDMLILHPLILDVDLSDNKLWTVQLIGEGRDGL